MTTTRKLDGTPGMMGLFARAAIGTVPGAGPAALRRRPRFGRCPTSSCVVEDVEIDPAHLAAYNKVCGFTLRDTLPPTYPHMLAFPLHLALMTDASFPYQTWAWSRSATASPSTGRSAARRGCRCRPSFGALEEHPKGRSSRSASRPAAATSWSGSRSSRELRRGADGRGAEPAGPERARSPRPADRLPVAPRGRPRPPLRQRLWRPEPDPPL